MCWHKWSKFGDVHTNTSGYKVQHRYCKRCGIVDFRKFWDGQTTLALLLKSIEKLKEEESMHSFKIKEQE